MDSRLDRKAMSEFYRLSDPLTNSAFRGEVGDLELYVEMERAKLGEGRPRKTPVIRRQMGWKLCDFIWVSMVPLIHQRVVDLLALGGVSGWSSYPVKVIDRKGEELDTYHGLCVVGRCESIYVDRREVVYRDLPGGRFPYYKGLAFTTDSWDGSDIFTSADHKTGFILVTQKVKDLFAKAKVTNVVLEPISEFIDPESTKDFPSYPKATSEADGSDRPQ